MITVHNLSRLLLLAAVPLFVGACANMGADSAAGPTTRVTPHPDSMNVSPAMAGTTARANAAAGESAERAKLFKGSGVLVKGQQPGGGLPPGPVTQPAGGGVVLNFEGADLREVIRNILGDILNESYTIDQSVGGTVTIRTSAGIPREALTATLETLLRMNGATMVKENGLFKIVPQAAAVRGNLAPQLGNSARALPAGYSVQIVPLRYVGVREMARILEPFVKDATAIRPDDLRNLLVLSGTERELKHLLDTIDTFDVDWMAGMSVGLFTLQSADVKTVGQELDKIIGDRNTSPLTGILRIIPMERLNALLVITPQPAYLEEAKKWIERLDRGGTEGAGLRFFVFHLQNQRAEKLAPLLQQAFTGRAAAATTAAAPTLAPGTPAGTITSPPAFQAQSGSPTPTVATPAPATPVPTPGAALAAARAAVANEGIGVVRNVQVVADRDNNTVLIVATQAEYSVIEAALRKLDVPARQVMIEVTIAEVQLTDDLEYGVEWYFTNGPKQTGGLFSKGTTPGNLFDIAASAAAAGLGPKVPGFSYLLSGLFPGGVQAAVSMLGTAGNTKIVANPHVAALDNQKATIKVGDRIPITQQTFIGSGTGSVSNAVTTTSQYIDTGVLLAVTPHINAGGLVQLEVQAEVSNPGNFNPGEAPPINTRSVQSILSVQSGQTMVMGGLISDTKIGGSSGIPLLSKIPIIGAAFGTQTYKDLRTELVLFITPRVVENEFDMKGVVDDLRRRMERLGDVFPGAAKPWGGSLLH
jgi:general secretion pathway protein D